MTVQVANNAQTTLAANITNVATAITLTNASNFPAASVASGNYFYATIYNSSGISEVVKVTDRTGNLLTMIRGVDGTTALAWTASGTSVGIFPVAAIINDLLASDAAILATIATKADTAVLSTLPRSAEYLVATGTGSPAYAITPTNPITSYIAGQAYEVQFPAICGDSPFIAVSGLSAKNIVVLADDGTYPNAAARDILAGSVSSLLAIDVGSGVIKFLLKDPAVNHSNITSISANTAFTIANAFGRVIKSTGSAARQHTLPVFSTWPLEGSFELISENTSMQVARQNAGDVIDYYGINLATNGVTGAFIDVPAGTHLKFIKNTTSWQVTAVAFQATPAGTIIESAAMVVPMGYLTCPLTANSNGSRATHAALWAATHLESAVTVSIASPCVVTWTAHGRANGDTIAFSTTGALPSGLAINTQYFIVNVSTNTFQLSLTLGGAAINTSGSQSGTHTAYFAPFGIGDGSTTFGLPWFPDGYSAISSGGLNIGQQTIGQNLAHTHAWSNGATTVQTAGVGGANWGSSVVGESSASLLSSGGAANLAAGVRINRFVKT